MLTRRYTNVSAQTSVQTCRPKLSMTCRSVDTQPAHHSTVNTAVEQQTRRAVLAVGVAAVCAVPYVARADPTANLEKMPLLEGKDYGKPRMRFPDFETTASGLQFKDLREGNGKQPALGSTVVVDWGGYTIGFAAASSVHFPKRYYGRPFEARNKPKGSAFANDDLDHLVFVLGEHKVIPGIEEAVAGMKEGGVRRIIVPVELGYPDNDFNKTGPAPTTFSGKRTLDFVLKNQGMIDKTLLFDIALLAVK